MDLLDTVGAEFDLGGEEINALVLVQWAVHEGRLHHSLFALGGLQQALRKSSTSHGHGESCRTGTVLGLDHLITAELDSVDQGIKLLARDVGVARLRDQGHDSDTRVATHNGDVLIHGIGALDLRDEAGGTDDIEGGDTEQTLGVVDTLALEDLGADGDGRVNLDSASAQCSKNTRLRAGRTGLEMTRTLALGAASAAAFARSRTMLALVLKRSIVSSARLL